MSCRKVHNTDALESTYRMDGRVISRNFIVGDDDVVIELNIIRKTGFRLFNNHDKSALVASIPTFGIG